LWNSDNSNINTAGEKLFRGNAFFVEFYVCKTEKTHAGVASS